MTSRRVQYTPGTWHPPGHTGIIVVIYSYWYEYNIFSVFDDTYCHAERILLRGSAMQPRRFNPASGATRRGNTTVELKLAHLRGPYRYTWYGT